MRKLEREGVIAGYRAIISPEALGFQQVMLIDVALESHSEGALKNFEEAIHHMEEVAAIDVLAGSFDFQLRIHSRDTADYERFLVSKLYRIPNVKTIRSNLVLRSIKTKSIF